MPSDSCYALNHTVRYKSLYRLPIDDLDVMAPGKSMSSLYVLYIAVQAILPMTIILCHLWSQDQVRYSSVYVPSRNTLTQTIVPAPENDLLLGRHRLLLYLP